MAVFTHNYEIITGGHTFEGEIEFNVDNKVSFTMNAITTALELEDAREIFKLFERVQIFFGEVGEFDRIEITKKP